MLGPIDNFSEAQAEALKRFLAAPERPEGTLSYPALAGFLFAVSNAPEMIAPSEWLPAISGEQEPVYESNEEMQEIMGAMFSLYNFTSRGGDDGQAKLPPGCRIFDDPMDNFGTEAPLGQWAAGFDYGRLWLEESWNAVLNDELEEEFNATVLILIFFADREFAEEFYQDALNDGVSKVEDSFEKFSARILSTFPLAMETYAETGRSIFKAQMEMGLYDKAFADSPAAGQMPGRNDPCPCGSGKKFKKCCLN